jgi:carbamoyltransferase
VALNCVANGKVLRSGAFERIWIQPAASDAGSAVGAAFAKWHLIDEHERPAGRSGDQMRGAALGPRVPEHEVERWLSQVDVPHRTFADRDELHRAVADHLAEGAVVGWFQGAMEFGPRALGHRSILADPRNPTVRERLNRSVKGREDFRPFAPCVLAEHAPTWFDLDHPSPYMLLVAQVRDEHLVGVADEPATLVDRASVARSTIPACTHVDGSARIQTVTSDDHVELHGLLRAFHERTGCPLLVNTSFNRAGDPIVRTPDQALQTARDAGMDVLVVEHALIALATAEEVAR